MMPASSTADTPDANIDSAQWRGLTLEVVSISAPGDRRHGNSDARLSAAAGGLLAVADGVSTLPGSAGAAQRCLEYLAGELRGAPVRDVATLTRIIQHISGRIFAEGRARRSGLEAGACTLDGVALGADEVTIFHVGDGGVWLGGDGQMRAMTTPQRCRAPSQRDPGQSSIRLAEAVGARPMLKPFVVTAPLSTPGAVLIASDGVVDVTKLAADPWFQGQGPVAAMAAVLESLGADNHPDDMTVVAARWRANDH